MRKEEYFRKSSKNIESRIKQEKKESMKSMKLQKRRKIRKRGKIRKGKAKKRKESNVLPPNLYLVVFIK